MPNIGTVLREEITRLSRKEGRDQVDSTKKATAQHRRAIAALKRQVARLERQVKLLSRKSSTPEVAVASHAIPATKIRFVAKGLKSQRERLGLSAGDFGKLVGVSAQSVYNWEGGHTRPRDEQISKIVQLRGIGKREGEARLAQFGATSKKRRAKE